MGEYLRILYFNQSGRAERSMEMVSWSYEIKKKAEAFFLVNDAIIRWKVFHLNIQIDFFEPV